MHPDTSVAAVVCAAAVLLISNGYLSMAMVEDKITVLPGQPPVSFAQYSGYVEVDAVRKRSLFYYFAEAELDPATKPLVLWLNGGKFSGCHKLLTVSSYCIIGIGEITREGTV